jgi:hypothetical protein
MAITPLSQLFNTFLFACFALTTFRFSSIVFQTVFVLCSLFFFRGRLGKMKVRSVLPVLPVIVFVLAVNCFRGSGEVAARFGVFVLVRQGLTRGVYYACVIFLLFVMSRLLTKGFPQDLLFNALFTVSRLFGRSKFARGGPGAPPSETDFLAVLFCVLGMFQVAYAEIRIFFRKGERSLKRKCIAYFYAVYEKSLDAFKNMDAGSWSPVVPLPFDYVHSALQVAVAAAALFVTGPSNWFGGP